MLIRTFHHLFAALDANGDLVQVADAADATHVRDIGDAEAVFELTADPVEEFFTLRRGDRYLRAVDNTALALDSATAGPWERFHLVGFDGTYVITSDAQRLIDRVRSLHDAGLPVKLHLACGMFPLPGFLDIDRWGGAPDFKAEHPDEYFNVETVGTRILLPDDSVDFIFHEDFIEHIDQTSQIQFLAETKRILKPGGVHRVNTPDLIWSMRHHSDFDKGWEGVYTGERQWDHIAIYSHAHLAEVARMVGYGRVEMMQRNTSVSPYAIIDRRPFGDRDPVAGNIFADLVK